MKKIIPSAIVLLVCVASVFVLASCNFEFEVESNWDVSADTAKDAKDIFDDFVANAYKINNATVTANNKDGLYFVEKIEGNKASVEYSYGSKAYAFVDGERYVAAWDEEDRLPYYIYSEEDYNYVYKTFAIFLTGIDEFLNEDGLTVSLTAKGEENKEGESATLSLTINQGNTVTKVTIERKDEQITRFKNLFNDGEDSSLLDISVEYGATQVVIPDMTDWFNASAPKSASEWYATGTIGGKNVEEIALYYDFTTGYYTSEYVDIVLGDSIIVKNKNDNTKSYTLNVDEEYLIGHEMISFDANDNNISFEADTENEDE